MAAMLVADLEGWRGGSLEGGEIPTAADDRSACGGDEGDAIVTGG